MSNDHHQLLWRASNEDDRTFSEVVMNVCSVRSKIPGIQHVEYGIQQSIDFK